MLFYLLCQVNSGRSNCSSECHRIPLKSLEVVQVYRRTAWPRVFLGQGAKRVLRLDFKKPSMRENSIETCILSRVKQITSPGWMHETSARAWSMDCRMPGFPVHHQLPELAQTHVHRVGDSTTISSSVIPFSSCFNLSQHQGLLKWVSSLY